MIIFNRHYKKTKLITFLVVLVYMVFPLIISTDTMLNLTRGQPVFLSWGVLAFLLLFTKATPAQSIAIVVVCGLLLWFLLYSFVRLLLWVARLLTKKQKPL